MQHAPREHEAHEEGPARAEHDPRGRPVVHQEPGERGRQHTEQCRQTVHDLGRRTPAQRERGDRPDHPEGPVGTRHPLEPVHHEDDPDDPRHPTQHAQVAVRHDQCGGDDHPRRTHHRGKPPDITDQPEHPEPGPHDEQPPRLALQRSNPTPLPHPRHGPHPGHHRDATEQRHPPPPPPLHDPQPQRGHANGRREQGGQQQGGGSGKDSVQHGSKLGVNVTISDE